MSIITTIKHLLRLDIKKNYISDIDKFFAAFDQQHPEKSASQQYEITKYQRINKKRDISS